MDATTRARVAGLAALVFLILGSYAVARPAIESLFLSEHGADALPQAWLGVALGSLLVVTIYNHWAARTDLIVLFGAASLISAVCVAVLLSCHAQGLPGSAFLLYLWKDIYIVVLIEIFWSFANSNIPKDKAQRIYGLFCVIGSLGGMAGNLLVGFLATWLGTAASLWAVIPLLLISAGGCALISRHFPAKRAAAKPLSLIHISEPTRPY